MNEWREKKLNGWMIYTYVKSGNFQQKQINGTEKNRFF